MPDAREALVASLGRLGLLRPSYRAYEAWLALRSRSHASTSSPDGLPLPPGRLILSVAGTADEAWFLESGRLATVSMRESLQRDGRALEDCDAILDFGCGCGRVLRHLRSLPASLSGTDANPHAVAWCRTNLPFASVDHNRLAPPLRSLDASFDLVSAFSVFTHIPEPLQRPWIGELRRVLRPGGYLVMTTHGERYAEQLSAEELRRFRRGQLVVRREAGAGTNLCTVFHPEEFVRRMLVEGFELVELVPEGAAGNPYQDLVLLRASDDSSTARDR